MNERNRRRTKAEEERIRENGQVTLEENGKRIHLLSIIGEIEGHDNLSGSTKTTSMNIFCRNLRRWRAMRRSEGS